MGSGLIIEKRDECWCLTISGAASFVTLYYQSNIALHRLRGGFVFRIVLRLRRNINGEIGYVTLQKPAQIIQRRRAERLIVLQAVEQTPADPEVPNQPVGGDSFLTYGVVKRLVRNHYFT